MKRVLIVDDDENFRQTLKKTLEACEYNVFDVPSGNAAKAFLEKEKTDVIISDIRMPDGNGIELLESIKTGDLNSPPIPVILMTGFSELIETKQAFEMGADGFLNKPFNRALLLQTLKSILDPKHTGPAHGGSANDGCD